MLVHATNPFATLRSVQAALGYLPKPRETWRLVRQPVFGAIQGLPRLRGNPVATNGILVVILRDDNNLVLGHLAWFVRDEVSASTDLYDDKPVKRSKATRKAPVVDLSEYY